MMNFNIAPNLRLIQKITLSGIFIGLIVILQKIIAVNYIPGLPFVRLSFGGPGLIIFSSILLGPWYGALIGGLSDLLGYVAFDLSGKALFPQITAIYVVLGFVSYYVFWAIRNLKNKKVMMAIEGFSFLAFFGAVLAYLLTRDLEILVKIFAPIALGILFIGLAIFIILFDRKYNFEFGFNVYQISFACFILDAVVLLAFGSLMKTLAFSMDIIVIAVCQMVVMFFNVAFNSIVISVLFKMVKHYQDR